MSRTIGAQMCLAVLVAVPAGFALPADGQPLTGLRNVGRVVVTVADDTVTTSDVRDAMQRHLNDAGIAIDARSELALVLKVAADRYRSRDDRCSYAAFWVTLELREPVSLRREPKRVLTVPTWSTSTRVYGQSATPSKEGLMSMVDTVMSRFSEKVQE